MLLTQHVRHSRRQQVGLLRIVRKKFHLTLLTTHYTRPSRGVFTQTLKPTVFGAANVCFGSAGIGPPHFQHDVEFPIRYGDLGGRAWPPRGTTRPLYPDPSCVISIQAAYSRSPIFSVTSHLPTNSPEAQARLETANNKTTSRSMALGPSIGKIPWNKFCLMQLS